jgi:hypothetical protein
LKIEKIENFDPFNNKIDIKTHSNTVKNEIKAQVFVLNEAFFRGNVYHLLKKKINSDDNFLKYCL